MRSVGLPCILPAIRPSIMAQFPSKPLYQSHEDRHANEPRQRLESARSRHGPMRPQEFVTCKGEAFDVLFPFRELTLICTVLGTY